MNEFGEEWKRRRNRRNKDLTSIWKLVARILLLIALIFIIKFFSAGGIDRFFDLLTGTNSGSTKIIMEETK
ncbi:MAG: hypothetical protein U9P79_03435 [Candidatus Cloacimonadota bacterium]|nr:hypothetical protein [Candidatus Cloacimonadota bacterium]